MSVMNWLRDLRDNHILSQVSENYRPQVKDYLERERVKEVLGGSVPFLRNPNSTTPTYTSEPLQNNLADISKITNAGLDAQTRAQDIAQKNDREDAALAVGLAQEGLRNRVDYNDQIIRPNAALQFDLNQRGLETQARLQKDLMGANANMLSQILMSAGFGSGASVDAWRDALGGVTEAFKNLTRI